LQGGLRGGFKGVSRSNQREKDTIELLEMILVATEVVVTHFDAYVRSEALFVPVWENEMMDSE